MSTTDALKQQIAEMQAHLAGMMSTLAALGEAKTGPVLPPSPSPSVTSGRALNPFAAFFAQNSTEIKRLRGTKKGLHLLCIAGRLWASGAREKATDAQINEAIAFLIANPDYKSASQQRYAAKTVTAEPKKRGRPRKTSSTASTAAATPATVSATPAAATDDWPEPPPVTDEREDTWDDMEVSPFEHERVQYFKSQYGDLFHSDSFAYLGHHNGTKVQWTTEAPPRVARYLAIATA